MKSKLMRALVCPVCKGKLKLYVGEKKRARIISGTLYCYQCDKTYPITDGLPNLLPPELEMPRYSLPFKPGDKLIELGGGTHPLVHPNVDCQQLPTVDIVADLEEPLPMENDSYDGVFSQFLMEHLRLTRVRGFISEVYRILKPEGIAVIITANLLEQAKWLVEKEDWDDVIIQMVFGGNPDYPENYHRSSLSPRYALKLFKEAGFQRVDIFEHPATKTDMVIEAKK